MNASLFPAIQNALTQNQVVLLLGSSDIAKTEVAKHILADAIYVDSSQPGIGNEMKQSPYGLILDKAHYVDKHRLSSLIKATKLLEIPTIIVCQNKPNYVDRVPNTDDVSVFNLDEFQTIQVSTIPDTDANQLSAENTP